MVHELGWFGRSLSPDWTHPAKVIRGFGAAIQTHDVHRLLLAADAAAVGLGEGVVVVCAAKEKVDDDGHGTPEK